MRRHSASVMLSRHFIPWILALISLCFITWQALTNRCDPCITELHEQTRKSEFEHCKLVYLDVGSNIGVQVRKLFEPSRYPGAPVLPLFDQYFGTNRSKAAHLCAIGVEMNPSHTLRLAALETHYRETCGYSVRFFKETAASTHAGTVDFWTDGDTLNEEWGASQMLQGNTRKHTNSRIANALDLVSFILGEIKPFASVVVMKMDIEGSEYELLPQLLMRGALCDMDLIFVEYHPWLVSAHQAEVVWHVNALLGNVSGCKAVLSSLDDESYHHDADPTMNTC